MASPPLWSENGSSWLTVPILCRDAAYRYSTGLLTSCDCLIPSPGSLSLFVPALVPDGGGGVEGEKKYAEQPDDCCRFEQES
jgi:hypothetical protein